MADIVMTGERFIPESNDAELELEHKERYYTASRFVEEKVVLDAACGEGYGSCMLAQKAKRVIGVDLDLETVERAKEKYKDCTNLEYKQGSVADLHFIEDHSIDVVVSFETIEHVPAEVQKEFLNEIVRVLKSDGILIMSSPNKKEYTDRYNFHNKFHVHELYVDEFVDLLKTKFKNVDLYRQYLEVASFIDRADKDEDVIQYHKNREKYNPEGKYVIAVAGNGELPQLSLSIASLHVREEYLSTLDELNYCRAEAIKCREKISENEEEMSGLHLQIDVEKNELKLANEELDRRMTELNVRQETINDLHHELDEKNNELKLANEELNRRMIELNNRMDVINKRNAEMCDLTHKLEALVSENLENTEEKKVLKAELEKIKAKKIYGLIKIMDRFSKEP